MNLGPWELIIIAVLIFALFGYKKLPDATRAVGRSLRIFKGEMNGMKGDDVGAKAEAQTTRAPMPPVVDAPVTNPVPQQPPAAAPAAQPVPPQAPVQQPQSPAAGHADPTAPPRP